LSFFGLPPDYNIYIHKQIFELSYYGEGGFPILDVYDLPIKYRNFYYNLLVQRKKQEEEYMNKSTSKKSGTTTIPNHVKNKYQK